MQKGKGIFLVHVDFDAKHDKPSVIGSNLTRIVGEQIFPDSTEMPERGMAPVSQIGRMSVPAEVPSRRSRGGLERLV